MAGKSTDRKNAAKAARNVLSTIDFVLPESLPCSEINFPILIEPITKRKTKWDDVVDENDKFLQEIIEYENKKNPKPKLCDSESVSDYMNDNVFVYLVPALEETLKKSKIWQALYVQKCFFNGIDHIAQLLWTNNPRYPARKLENLHIFNMYWVRRELEKNPRPYYPKSWLWPEEYAATIIQKTVRRYFVQRPDEVQEMRDFWKKLALERERPEISTNPLLAKTLAEKDHIHMDAHDHNQVNQNKKK